MKNISASIRQKLKNIAKNENKPFAEILQYYAMERFLYRLSKSPYINNFVLKGALMLVVWNVPDRRVTMDIDMLGKQTSNQEQDVEQLIKEILLTEVFEDGLVFDTETLKIMTIKEDSEYSGIRATFKAFIDSARIPMQIDIGFGDVVYPEAKKELLQSYLSMPAPEVFCYSKESAIAEKFEAIIKLDLFNSRMKDFYDIWLMSRCFDISIDTLSKAINKTFNNRGTILPKKASCFESEFCEYKQEAWKTFLKKIDFEFVPNDLHLLMQDIKKFLKPVITEDETQYKKWISKEGQWS